MSIPRRPAIIAAAALMLSVVAGSGAMAATVAAAYDVQTTYTISGPLTVGSIVNLTLRATNAGSEAYPYNVTAQFWLTDAVKRSNPPASLLCEAYRGTHGGSTVYRDYCHSTMVGPIPAGGSIEVVLPVKLITAGDTNSVAETTSGEPFTDPCCMGVFYPNLVRVLLPIHIDPAPAAGGGGVGTTTGTPDLQTTAKATTGSPAAGSAFGETFTVKNSGKGGATGVTFSAAVPAGVVISNVQGSSICTVSGQLVSCTVADLAPGASTFIQLDLVAPSTAGSLTTSGTFGTGNGDSNPANDAAAVTVTVK